MSIWIIPLILVSILFFKAMTKLGKVIEEKQKLENMLVEIGKTWMPIKQHNKLMQAAQTALDACYARYKGYSSEEESKAKTITCLANFGYIPEKFNDGSQLHRAINEAIERARKEHVQDPV